MNTSKKTARIAGFIYLIVVLAGIFSLAYVPSKLIVWGNANATFNAIVASETLFRLGIVAGVICYIAFLFLPLVLYKLLHQVSKPHAISMVILAVVSVPISLVNLLNKFAVLTLISNASYLSIIDADKLQVQVLLYLESYNNGIELVSIFWGLWLLPFGYLVFKSGFLPKILGILLMAGCLGYLINFIGSFLFQGYAATGIARFISLPASLGEIGICLWLLIVGIRDKYLPVNYSNVN
jgi:hypothetical protein